MRARASACHVCLEFLQGTSRKTNMPVKPVATGGEIKKSHSVFAQKS